MIKYTPTMQPYNESRLYDCNSLLHTIYPLRIDLTKKQNNLKTM